MATILPDRSKSIILRGILGASMDGPASSGEGQPVTLYLHALTTPSGAAAPGVFNGPGLNYTVATFKTAVGISDTSPTATLPFKFDDNLTDTSISNSAASGIISITANKVVWYLLIADGSATTANVIGYIRLSSPATQYKYDVAGTLRINQGGYTIGFNVT